MGQGAKKTEHAGAKKGNGAYWGRKRVAKQESNRVRRENDKETSHDETGKGHDGHVTDKEEDHP
ncbi:MAG: hypothetical protein BWK76_12165 [Desulfobulbaceae bacterium A2]|nr:MAG: hypothetical protein BWK76_12165 [Desulfobulbaceae bacterium A2]